MEPASPAGSLARRLVAARGARGFVDGLVSVVLAADLARRGFSAFEIGVLVTAALLGSALLTLAVGLLGHRLREAAVLAASAALMLGTGLGFAGLEGFAALCLVSFLGTLNPSGHDLSVFLPVEQSLLASSTAVERRTAVFGGYAMVGNLSAALGSLASGASERAGLALGFAPEDALRSAYWLYAAVGLALAFWYRPLLRASAAPMDSAATTPSGPRPPVRPVLWKLSALFTLDSFGGGLAVQALLALWLMERFGLSVGATGAFFFASGVLSALSQLASAPLARRIGLVRTMVYTHVPANLALLATAFAPNAEVALGLLAFRAATSQMDVPARQALVMNLVPAAERPAAASITNVPRSLGGALAPLVSGALIGAGSGGAALLAAGLLKLVYDGLLLGFFHSLEREPPNDPTS